MRPAAAPHNHRTPRSGTAPRLPRLALAAAATLLVALAAGAQAQQDGPHDWQRTDFDFTSWDGTVLKASMWEPEGNGPYPAILTSHGWPGRHDQGATVEYGEHYATKGYVVVAWTARGFGDSGGQSHLNGPEEVKDVQALIDWLAEHPKVLLDGPGDPRVGMVGTSYGGGIQLLAAQQDSRIDAIAPVTTWNNLLGSLAPGDVIKLGWVSLLYGSGTAATYGVPVSGGEPNPDPGSGPMAKLHEWYLDAVAHNRVGDEARHELGTVRSVAPGTLDTPTLLVQGWPDTLFPPSEALDTYQGLALRGVPVRLVLYPGGHGGFYMDRDDPLQQAVDAQIDDWFRVHLKGEPHTLPPYPVLRYRAHSDDYVGEMQWPPAGALVERLHLDGMDLSTDPPGPDAQGRALWASPTPTSCTEVPNFQSLQALLCPSRTLEATAALWTGPALDEARELTGTPLAHFHVHSRVPRDDTTLFLYLVDIDPDGRETPILSQVAPVRLAGLHDDPVPVTVQLPTLSHLVPAGHSVGLVVASNDLAYSASREAGILTIQSDAQRPGFVLLPWVPQDAWGDHEPPRISIDAGSVDPDGALEATVVVHDHLGARTATLEAEGRPVEALGRDGDRFRFRIDAAPLTAGGGLLLLHATAEDLAGNTAEEILHIHVPCRTDCPQQVRGSPTPTESDGRFVPAPPLAALALALAGLGLWVRRGP